MTAPVEELIELLATDGMLVKRPLIVCEDRVVVGFREKEYLSLLDD
ncbi:MAG: ArsC/Spx/MgsR family protein [Rikenellaceae bacterium]